MENCGQRGESTLRDTDTGELLIIQGNQEKRHGDALFSPDCSSGGMLNPWFPLSSCPCLLRHRLCPGCRLLMTGDKKFFILFLFRSPSTTGSWCTTPTTSISPLPSRLSSCRPAAHATMAPSLSLIKSLPCNCSITMILHRCNPQPPPKCISPFTIKTFKQPNPFHPRQCFTSSSHLDSLIKKENQKQTCLLSIRSSKYVGSLKSNVLVILIQMMLDLSVKPCTRSSGASREYSNHKTFFSSATC